MLTSIWAGYMRKEYLLRFFESTILATTLALTSSVYASALSDAADTLQAGDWMEFNTQGYGGSLLDACDGEHSILEWSNKAVWNPVRREVLFVGQGHVSCAKHIRFQESSNAWSTSSLPAGIETFGHGFEHNTVDPMNGDLYYRNYNSDQIERFDGSSGSWSPLPRIGSSTQVAGAIEYFPEAEGLLYVDGDFGVYFYEKQSNAWSLIANTAVALDNSKPTASMGPYGNFASYNPVDKVVYFGGGNDSNRFYKLSAQGQVSQLADSPVPIRPGTSLTVADPSTGLQLVFSDDGVQYEYSSGSNTWSNAGTHPVMDYARDWRIATPISTHGVIMFLTWDFSDSKVLLYRYGSVSRPREPTDLR